MESKLERKGTGMLRPGRRGRQHTWQRDAVMEALASCDDFVSAQDLYRKLSDGGQGIGLSTVYRQLNALADDGQADTIHLNDQQMFRMCQDGEHHHHLVCANCGKTVEIEPPEQWVRTVAEKHGFTVISHTLEVFGLCPDCQQEVDAR